MEGTGRQVVHRDEGDIHGGDGGGGGGRSCGVEKVNRVDVGKGIGTGKGWIVVSVATSGRCKLQMSVGTVPNTLFI